MNVKTKCSIESDSLMVKLLKKNALLFQKNHKKVTVSMKAYKIPFISSYAKCLKTPKTTWYIKDVKLKGFPLLLIRSLVDESIKTKYGKVYCLKL